MSAISSFIARGLQEHRAGDLELAEHYYRDALKADPQAPDALHLLGVLALQRGAYQNAVNYIRQAVKFRNTDAAFHSNLGFAQHELGHYDEAVASYREALRLDSRRAETHNNLGNTLAAQNSFAEAAVHFRQAIEITPQYAKAHLNLGRVLQSRGDHPGAIDAFEQAVQLAPDAVLAYFSMAESLHQAGRLGEAIEAYEQFLCHRPDCVEAIYNKGVIELDRYQLAQAARTFQSAIGQNHRFSDAHLNLGTSLLAQGRVRAAVASFRAAVQIRPDDVTAYSNILLSRQYDPTTDAEELSQEHRHWAVVHERPVQPAFAHNRDPQRQLHIGYVSPDMRAHAVSYFFEPLLRHHRSDQFHVTCYADVKIPDDTTARLRSLADGWRNTYGLSDENFASRVQRDQVDILVDLAGHTAGHRLAAFGRKPAPIQVSYLGYGSTTGLEGMDYRITDQYTDPVGEPSLYTESLVRHPLGFACYFPEQDAPQVTAPPVFENGRLTFGSFNNVAKISPPVVKLWTQLLLAVPGSRLLLKSPSFNDSEVVSYWRRQFGTAGLQSERLELQGRSGTIREHLANYRQVDIALDPFPYTGSTTTCEALWMGVPVVTLRGGNYVGRMTSALLQWISTAELIAESPEDYMDIARQLAADANRLAEYRNSLRQRMQQSPICNSAAYTQTLEDLYRAMWRRWCGDADLNFPQHSNERLIA